MTKKYKESLEPFEINSSDKIRVQVEQRNLQQYNKLNNDDLSINIISNSYIDIFFIINDKKQEARKFSILPEITIFEKKVVYHFYNREEDITIDVLDSEKDKVFKIV